MFPRGPVPEIESDSPDCCQHLQVQTSITAPAHTEGLTMTQTGMTSHQRNSTGTNVNASRDDGTLVPTTQPNASRQYRTFALKKQARKLAH